MRTTATELVELVLGDDYSFLDALPEAVESAIVTPMATLNHVLHTAPDPVTLVVAARVVARSVEGLLADCPSELNRLIAQLPR